MLVSIFARVNGAVSGAKKDKNAELRITPNFEYLSINIVTAIIKSQLEKTDNWRDKN